MDFWHNFWFTDEINSALLDLEFLMNNTRFGSCAEEYDALSNQLRNLRTFHLFAGKWGDDYFDDDDDVDSLEDILFWIEYVVSQFAKEIHCHYDSKGVGCLVHTLNFIPRNFGKDINRWYIKFSDSSRQSTFYSPEVGGDDLVEFIDSIPTPQIYQNGALVCLLKTLEEDLTFLKNFIRLLTDDDDDCYLRQNLLIHIKAVALSAAHHTYMCQQYVYRNGECDTTEMEAKISELRQRINPVDPLVYHDYIQALNGLNGLKSSRQSLSLTLDPLVYHAYIQALNCLKSSRQSRLLTLEILQNFIASLIFYLFGILKSDRIPAFSNKNQLHILYEGLRYLRTILKKQPMNFDQKTQDLTRVVVCDAGLVVFSLFRDTAIEDGLVQKMDQVLFDLLKRIHLIRSEIAGISLQGGGSSSTFNFPKVDELGFIDFLLENLKELTSCEEEVAGSTAIPKHQIQTICEQLVFLRSFLGKIVQLRNEMEELRVLWNRVVELAYRVEFLIDSLVIGDISDDYSSQTSFDSITQEINILELEALKISVEEALYVTKRSNDFLPLERSVPIIKDEIICLDDEARAIMYRLKRGAEKLQIVPIVGMPGLGKTTLAKLVYNDFSIMHHFRIRAWCCISQIYDKKNLFLQILTCISSGFSDKCEEDLAQSLRQNLLKKKYLIVLDDVWNIDAWNILKDSFPDDKNGSRIILTSRFREVAPIEKLDGEPHFLRHLSDNESWELLTSKLFPSSDWPLSLCELGIQIVKRCKGLPLMIIILAGILSSSEQGDWRDVVEHCLSSSSAPILEQCNNTLELSYRCLPDKLKPCLLYFGAFPEDRKHSVNELTWLWIAEGFVCKEQSKSSEDEAKGYLMYLISRSLVMVDKLSSTGEVKTCCIHDLLHSFCVEKANNESFFQLLKGYDELSNFNEPQNVRRLGIYSKIEHLVKSRLFCLRLRSLFFFCSDIFNQIHGSCFLLNTGIPKLVRVLELRDIDLGDIFPGEITSMVQLRYLAVRGKFRSIPSSIANLSNLETLIVDGSYEIELPLGFWKLKKLRHLETTDALFIFRSEDLGNSAELLNLETLCSLSLCWEDWEMILKKFPNIRKINVKLSDYGAFAEIGENNKALVLDFLNRLESVEVIGGEPFAEHQIDICFPLNLRKLDLESLRWPWCKISPIGKLPNLVVLKILDNAFEGEIWNMEEEGLFTKLKFLKLAGLDIVKWIASEFVWDHFPCLTKLVLEKCYRLEDVPSCLGDIPNLQMIQVNRCSKSAASSIMQIYENQVDMGNEDLKVLIDTECDSD